MLKMLWRQPWVRTVLDFALWYAVCVWMGTDDLGFAKGLAIIALLQAHRAMVKIEEAKGD